MASPTDFLARVLPWPGPGEDGFVNIHWRLVGKKPPHDLFWAGRACTTLPDFMGNVRWGVSSPGVCRDIYYCLSVQKEHGGFTNGKTKAKRNANNALGLKALWLDIDIKEAPKGYPTLAEALTELLKFTDAINIPDPTAVVYSGGGVHAYWISDEPLSVEVWRCYAEGLKAEAMKYGLRADHVCTADAARILRVPGTFNFKEATPREVILRSLKDKDINFPDELGHIAKAFTAAVKAQPKIQMASAFAALDVNESLSDGVRNNAPLSWEKLFIECAFFKDALDTGGKEHPEPLWSLALLASTFFDDGEQRAHLLSNQHPDYSQEGTTAKYQQKLMQKEQNKLGYPSCAAFKTAGCKFCDGCPHFAKGKSPLTFAHDNVVVLAPAASGSPFVNSSISQASKAMGLPDDGRYFVDEQGYICEMVKFKGKKGEDEDGSYPIRLFACVIKNPRSHGAPSHGLSFDAKIDVATWVRAFVSMRDRASQTDLVRALNDQGVYHNHDAEALLRRFILSWITKLNSEIAAMKNRAFGWVIDEKDGTRVGFSFGGKTYYRDGKEEFCQVADNAVRTMYEPKGTKEAWLKALSLITEQKRPHLDIITLAAFATPLLWATGGTGGTFAVYGKSGIGKTSAVKVALSVWGDPLLTKLKPNSTANFIEERLGTVDCLPLVIDDMQTTDEFTQICKMVFEVTASVNKGRLKQNAESRAQKKSRSSLIVTANNSLYDFMFDSMRVNTEAQPARVLEVEIPPGVHGQGMISQTDAEKLLENLEYNHGMIGQDYAKWLVHNIDYVNDYCENVAKGIEAQVAIKEQERFWKSFIASVLAAGHFVEKAFGIQYDMGEVHRVLIQAFMDCRRRIETAQVEGHTQSAIENILAAFIGRYYDHQIYTETVPSGKGKPGSVKYLGMGPKRNPVVIQWVVEDRKLRLDKPTFLDFLIDKKYPTSSVLNGLVKHFGASINKKYRLAGGTDWATAPTATVEIPIPMHHFLEPTLFQLTKEAERPDHVRRLDAITATVSATPNLDTLNAAARGAP